VLLVAAIAGGSLAVIQRGQARDAAAEARNAETAQVVQRLGAQALVENDLDVSLLLARQAVAIEDTPQTHGYLLAALRRAPAAIGIMHARGDALLRSIALSPDGTTLVVGDPVNGLLFFDVRTYVQIGDLPVGQVESLAFSPDGRTLAVGGDHYVHLYDARTHDRLAEMAVGGVTSRMAFTKDGSQLAVLISPGSAQDLGGANAQITIRDAATLEPIGALIEPEAFVGGYVGFYYASPHFALSADDRSLITASEDGELVWWDLRSRERMRTLTIESGGRVHALALSPDGRTAAVGINRGIQLVDLGTGTVRTATGGLTGSPNWVLFSPDSKTVVSTNLDGTVTVWDVESATPRDMLRGHSNSVQQPVFSLDGGTLYTVSHDGTAIAWDLTNSRRLGRPFTFTHDRTFSAAGFDGHPGEFSPDGRLIAVGLKEQGVQLWDARGLSPVGSSLLETDGEVKALAFSPDGQTLAAATSGGLLTLWNVDTRSRLHGALNARGGTNMSGGLSFSPDGATLATASGLGVRLLDMATGAVSVIGSKQVGDLAFSADGAVIAFSRPDQGGAEVWDVTARTLIVAVEGTPPPFWDLSVALSPDGRTLAVGGFGRVVRVWDVRTGTLVHELDQGGNGALTLEFSPDGRVLAVSGFEPVASLWDVETGIQIGPQLTAGDRRTMIDLSPDGRRLLETHGNGQGAVWDVDPESWAQRACAIAGRTLTPEEWDEFLPGRPYEPACTT
jgi:WD40 repeat protein